MNFKRIGRILVCLLLICCLTFHAMIPRAEATGLEAAIPAAGSLIVTPAGVVVGATLIALGLYAAADPEGFENIKNAATDAMEAAGTWIKDGTVELLRMVDELGNASYYVDSGFMEDVRSYALESSIIQPNELVLNESVYPPSDALATAAAAPYSCLVYYSYGNNPDAAYYILCYSYESSIIARSSNTDGTGIYISVETSSASWYTYDKWSNSWDSGTGQIYGGNSNYKMISAQEFGEKAAKFTTTHDITLGVIPSVPVDGTSARQWSEDYTDRGLKVYGGGSGNNNNDGKWFWPVVLVAGADLLAMSQADAWAGETPQEFDDYTTVEELEIVSRPEVDFAQGVELAPVTSPAPDTGGDTGSDNGTESGNQTDYTSWFQKIIKGIEELPSKFESWITDCKTAIEELPSKFADWFNSIIEKLSSIWETLKSIPQAILDGFRQLLSDLFMPSSDFIPNKVEALHQKYPYLDTFQNLGTSLKDYLIGLGVSPPIIYIDLGAARNSYVWGGKQIFIDLTWYAEYKPTMDFIISGFLWLWFAFRLWQSAPGIIQGTSGMWGDGNAVPDYTFHMPKYQQGNNWLNSGSSYHGRGTGSRWKKDGG